MPALPDDAAPRNAQRSWPRRIARVMLALLALLLLLAGGLGAAAAFFISTLVPLPTSEAVLDSGAVLVNDGGGAFLVPTGAGHAIAIDCTNDVAAKAMKAALTARKLTLDAILLTHAHPDHVHGCAALAAPVAALQAEVPAIEGRTGTNGPVGRMMGPLQFQVKVANALRDGDVLRYQQKSVRVFAVPGHTAGSAAYLVDGVLYFGDATAARKDGSFTPPLWVVSDDPALGLASLRALAARLVPEDVTTFAFAHSGFVKADLAALAAAH